MVNASSNVFIFLETKFLYHYGPKVRAKLPLVLSRLEVQGRSFHDNRQGHLSSGSEQSRWKCWGWESGVTVSLSYGSTSSSYTFEYGSIALGTHFAKGIVKTCPPRNSAFKPFQRIPELVRSLSHSSTWGTKVLLPETCILLFIRGLQQTKPATKPRLIPVTVASLCRSSAIAGQ